MEKATEFDCLQSVTISLGTLVPNAGAHVFPTGVSSTISAGSIDGPTVFAYSEVDTGTHVVYTEVEAA